MSQVMAISEGSVFIYMTLGEHKTCSMADPVRTLDILPEIDQLIEISFKNILNTRIKEWQSLR